VASAPPDTSTESRRAIRGNLKLQIAGFRPTALSKPATVKPPLQEKPTQNQPISRSSRTTIEYTTAM
ncbi:MAG TPA: hypothetical protein VFR21_04025, partial [Bradyrhizobium sp.]|nr:hypothetical protein [Bradyrhizobium sp.]